MPELRDMKSPTSPMIRPFCSYRTCWRLHISQFGHLLEILTSTLQTSHMLHDVQNIFEVPILSRRAWHTELSSSHQHASARHSQCLQLLARVVHLMVLPGCNSSVSTEDNPPVTDPVRVVAAIIFQLSFLKECIKIQRNGSMGH